MNKTDVMIYVQHLLGIGHVRRMALIIAALRQRGLHVTVASGGMPDPALDFGADMLVQLPPCKSADSDFSGLIDQHGHPLDDAFRTRRRQMLLDAFEQYAPRLLLVEMFPFGRRAFRFELLPLLEHAAMAGVMRICSVRDLLVRKSDITKEEWMRDTARRHFDAVLVHGDPALFGFDRSFPFAADLADMIEYTGYVAPMIAGDGHMASTAADTSTGASRQGVLVSAGGGAVGGALLTTAIAASALSRRFGDARWDIVTGPHFPAGDFENLQSGLPANIVLHRFLPDFAARMARAAVSVSQAGYNTLMDVLATQTPAVMVPFADGGESEQGERAAILARKGVISVVSPENLTAQNLANQIDRANIPSAIDISLDGAGITAAKIAARLKGHS